MNRGSRAAQKVERRVRWPSNSMSSGPQTTAAPCGCRNMAGSGSARRPCPMARQVEAALASSITSIRELSPYLARTWSSTHTWISDHHAKSPQNGSELPQNGSKSPPKKDKLPQNGSEHSEKRSAGQTQTFCEVRGAISSIPSKVLSILLSILRDAVLHTSIPILSGR